MRRTALLICAAMTAGGAPAAEQATTGFAPLEFLVGHCWKGSFPDGQATDEHCFAWLYGRQFVRDVHHVRDAAGKVVYEGETTYWWDAARGAIAWRYLSVQGLVMDGTVSREGGDLVFPATYTDARGTHEVRASWTPSADGYRAVNAEKSPEGWQEQFTVEFSRVE
jgi:hypothetical protein